MTSCAIGVGEHRLPELGLEVLEPADGELGTDGRIVTRRVEERVAREEAHVRVRQHRPVVGPLAEHQGADRLLVA